MSFHANGTDALQIAMMGLDLKPGDEVTADLHLQQLLR
jgi:dTDP-4-amino-4,6-dideoxygalactose transaminase